jgi:hypothetical protein
MSLRSLATAVACSLLGATLLANASAPAKPASPPAETKSTAAAPVPHATAPPHDRGVSWGGSGGAGGVGEDVTIGPDETYDGDVVCVRGHARIEGHVNGNVTVVLGTLDLSGAVSGDVVTVLSGSKLAPSTVVEGDLTNVAGSLERSGATITGHVVNIPVGIPSLGLGPRWGPGASIFYGIFFWWKLFALFLFFVCALVLAALVPDRIRLISEEVPVQVFLTITLIGIPLAFLLFLSFTVLKWLAMCGIFHQLGWRIGRAFGREMSLLGGILLGLLPFALLRFLPLCIGWSIWFLVEIVAFGCLIVTRVGTRRSLPIASPHPPPHPPPPPPAATIDPEISPAG